MANFALNYSFSRNTGIPLDEDAVKSTYAEVLTYVQTRSKCYAGQLFSVVGDGDKNGLYIAVTKGPDAVVVKLASQEALEAVAQSAGKIDTIKLNGSALTINEKTVNIDLSNYATIDSVNEAISGLTSVFAPKAEFEEVQKKVDDITSVGGEPNVQSDWNVIDETSDAFIKNKPNLDVYAVATAVTNDIAVALNSAKTYTNEEITKISGVVSTLVGEDADKSARAIAAEEVAKVVASANTDFDTLKEIADWILNDTTGAANMANDIAALKEEDIKLDSRLDTLEGVKHSHTNQTVLDGITAEKVAAWDAAEKNASSYTDTKIAELSSVYDVKGAAASAETAAKAHAEGVAASAESAAKAHADAVAASALTAANSYADGLAVNYDAAGAAASALTDAISYTDLQVASAKTAAKNYADGLAVNYDAAGAAASALTAAKSYADSLAINYDAAGAADTALNSAKSYTSQEIGKLSTVYDAKGSAESALTAAQSYADGLAVNYDAVGAAASALTAAKNYADSLSTNYDAAGAASTAAGTALSNAKIYTDDEIGKLSSVYDAKGAAASAETAAKAYAEDVAASAETAAKAHADVVADSAITVSKKYVDDKLVDYATESFVSEKIVSALTNGTVDITGYAKNEDVKAAALSAKTEAIADASAYTDSEIAKLVEVYASKSDVETLIGVDSGKTARAIAAEEVTKIVDGADEAFDTLKEIAEWIGNGSGTTAAKIVTDIANLQAEDERLDGRLDALELLSGQSHTHLNKALLDTYTQTNEDLADAVSKKHSHDNKDVLDGITDVKVAAWDAAEQNAKDYADDLAVNYDAAGAAASAETAAKKYADTLVANIKPYESGVATSIAMNEETSAYTVDVKVSDDEKNFLNVNAENELEVKEITLDAAKTSKDITVEGGAWESIVKPVFGNTVPAGTTWESFLEAMLCVEKFAGTISTSSAFTVSCGNINPGISVSNKATVEVGTKVTLNATTANSTTASQSLTASSFTYGYKMGENGERTTATAYTETLTPVKTKANDALKITFSNFTNADGQALQTISGNGSLAKVEMVVVEGTNKVTVAQTGDTYAASSAITADTIYVSTNLKNYYKSDKVTPNTYTITFPATSATASDTTEYTVTGAHKYYIGDVTEYNETYWDTDRSEVVRGLSTSGWANTTTITKAHDFKVGTKQQTVVVPAKFTSVSGKDVNNGDVTFNLVKTFDFTNKQGAVSSYKVFVAPAYDGLGVDSTITITIK